MATQKTSTVPAKQSAPQIEDQDEDEDVGVSSGPSKMTDDFQAGSGVSKNFRSNPDVENFFRFIFDNDLRLEALKILDTVIAERKVKKLK